VQLQRGLHFLPAPTVGLALGRNARATEATMMPKLLALPLLLLAVSCAATVDPSPVVCVPDGAACSVDDDCCGEVCTAGACVAPANSCLEDNVACTDDFDCCSNVCTGEGFCGYPVTVVVVACAADDDACTEDADCCSNVCASDGFCGQPVDCTVDNDPCTEDSDCCSNVCASDGFCGLP
jgi:hypothetical protein